MYENFRRTFAHCIAAKDRYLYSLSIIIGHLENDQQTMSAGPSGPGSYQADILNRWQTLQTAPQNTALWSITTSYKYDTNLLALIMNVTELLVFVG